jgi:hypothetical protein
VRRVAPRAQRQYASPLPYLEAAITRRSIWILVLLALVAGCSRKAQWQEFNSPAGHFAATFPGNPDEKTKAISTAEGPVEMHEFLATSGQRAFLVTYSDYVKAENEVPAAQRMAGWRSGVISDRKLLSERELTLDGVPGREMVMVTTEGLRVTARGFFRGKRLYQALVAAPTSDLGPEDTEHFLASFKLLPE